MEAEEGVRERDEETSKGQYFTVWWCLRFWGGFAASAMVGRRKGRGLIAVRESVERNRSEGLWVEFLSKMKGVWYY